MDGVCGYYISWCVSELPREETEHSWQSSFWHLVLSLPVWFILILIEMIWSRTRKWTLRNCSWETKIFFSFSRNRKILLILTRLPWNWSSLSPATSPWCSLPLLSSCTLCFGAWAQATSLCSIAFAFKCLVFLKQILKLLKIGTLTLTFSLSPSCHCLSVTAQQVC